MTDSQSDPTKTITVNYCEVCNTRYSLEEAKARDMSCCGKPLKQETKRVSVPLGP